MKIVNLKVSEQKVRNAEVVGSLKAIDIVTVNGMVVATIHDETNPRRSVLTGTREEIKTFALALLSEVE